MMMMRIITSDDELRPFFPNQVVTVEGELSLYQKLLPWLEAAEMWVQNAFAGEEVLAKWAADKDSAGWNDVAAVIACDALLRALPGLDLVLTPNGLGIVNNQNVVPASPARVERLLNNLRIQRDMRIDNVLDILCREEAWELSAQRAWLAESLVQRTSFVRSVMPDCMAAWERFGEVRLQAMAIEKEMAERWVSEAVMRRLRLSLSFFSHSPAKELECRLANLLLAELQRRLKGNAPNEALMSDVVEVLRDNSAEFPEWAESPTAKLFAPPVFHNEKRHPGYFF